MYIFYVERGTQRERSYIEQVHISLLCFIHLLTTKEKNKKQICLMCYSQERKAQRRTKVTEDLSKKQAKY